MTEKKLRKQLLYLMLTGKIVLIFYIVLHTRTGGFLPNEGIAAITLIIPLFLAYLGTMYKDFTRRYMHEDQQGDARRIDKSFRNLSYITLLLYIIALIIIVTLKASGALNFEQFQTTLALAESAFGFYVGQVVFRLYKSENNHS